jgi:hypothetical protein
MIEPQHVAQTRRSPLLSRWIVSDASSWSAWSTVVGHPDTRARESARDQAREVEDNGRGIPVVVPGRARRVKFA